MRKWNWLNYALLFAGAFAFLILLSVKVDAFGSTPQKDVKIEESADNDQMDGEEGDSAEESAEESEEEVAEQPVEEPKK